MPQMNPMNWTLLLVLFNSIFVLLMAKMHFFKFMQPGSKAEMVDSNYEVPSFTKEI